MQAILQLAEHLNSPKKIVITTHQFPDADALGSSLGLMHFLAGKGHACTVISSTPFPENLAWMQGANDIVLYDKHKLDKTQSILDASDMLFCLDFNIISRTKDLAAQLQNYAGTKVLIDHHEEPDTAYFNYGISSTAKSSTCEMVYDFIVALEGDRTAITAAIAECLYAGVMTDTGSFRFASTTADTHAMIANLMRTGITSHVIHERIYDTFPEKRLRLQGFLLMERLVVMPEIGAAYMWLTEADSAAYNVQQGDTEGFVNLALGIKGIDFAAFVSSRDGDVRMSFRSKGNVDVNTFARKYFNGGGHFNAAGGRGEQNVESTVETLVASLKEWKK
ncbi:MAG: hypothetical protein RL660_3086 [Bacteroidota bacterium]|jgi:phosphoesterase RecJ-like protein